MLNASGQDVEASTSPTSWATGNGTATTTADFRIDAHGHHTDFANFGLVI